MFIINNKYEREELLDFIGSKQPQSGILWNKNGGDSIIITTGGRHTKRVGYSDQVRKDGTWVYTGQGEKGDQKPDSFANSLLINGNKNILLFSTAEPNAEEVRARGHHKKQYRFEGIFRVKSWHLKEQKEGKRKGDKLINFVLEPVFTEDLNEPQESYVVVPKQLEKKSIEQLRKNLYKGEAYKNKNGSKSRKQIILIEYKTRSIQIKNYALLRSKGKCELCLKPAPFVTNDGNPFLEVHHIFCLGDDGPDHPLNVAAICPNCHREAHYGQNKKEIKVRLSQIIQDKEKLHN